ncbi:MAG: GNAT family N-acetyltransferase [Muribaculaceae bacterium]|nr:GNAT family N-acetyltransferase [Muribaculaceae bacterium]
MDREIKLRAVEPDDARMMYEAENDEAAWVYSDYLAPLSHELLLQYALSYDADPFRSGQLRLIIETGNAPAGILDLFDISARHLRADTGIYIFPDFRGRGIGRVALEAAKEYSKKRLGLHQLTATVAHSNAIAKQAYQKAGFKLTGTRPDWLRNPDGFESVDIFSCML